MLAATSANAWAQPPQITPAARSWSPDIAPALDAYRSGDFAAGQQLSLALLAHTRDSAARLDAAVVQALCLLRSAARADRIDGEARLRQLAATDLTLLDEPECNLALGIAQTELSQTADALQALDRARAEFARQHLPARQTEALVALAAAWAHHNEWDATPPQFGARHPSGPDEANAIRREQIERVRAQIAALPDHESALADVDLILADLLLMTGDPQNEALGILGRLAAVSEWTPTAARAAFQLAEQYEARGEWEEALRQYRRLAEQWHGELAAQAQQRAADIGRPQIVIDLSVVVPSGQRVRPHVRVRGLDVIALEVRQVDVDTWLNTPGTRGNEALLPETGALRGARDLRTQAAVPHGWWDSGTLESPFEFDAGPGAYVVIARAPAGEHPRLVVKRLVVLSDLRAVCMVGAEHAVLWALPPADADDAAHVLDGKFWMSRSFAPTILQFDGSVARFALPGEARVLRDKEWICFVRWGEHMAICRGRVPGVTTPQAGAALALLAGPPQPAVGGTLFISGLLWPPPESISPAPVSVELQIVDALGAMQSRQMVDVEPGGSFAAEAPILPEYAGKNLRVLARCNGRTMENVLGRAFLSVLPRNPATLHMRILAPSWLSAESTTLQGRLEVEYPWGPVAAGARVDCGFHSQQLPDETGRPPSDLYDVLCRGWLGDEGQASFAVPLARLGVARGPAALKVEAQVRNEDGYVGNGQATVLVGANRPYAWLIAVPARPHAGQAVRFRVGGLDAGLALEQIPEVVVRQDPSERARLRLQPAPEGWTSAAWPTTQPGHYEATAVLPVHGAEPLTVRREIEVLPAVANAPPGAAPLRCVAHVAREGARRVVAVELDGQSDGPLLLIAENGDPQAARALLPFRGHADVLLPLPDKVGATGLRIALADPTADVQCIASVAPDPDDGLGVELATEPGTYPGATTVVRVTTRRAGGLRPGTILLARLIDAAGAGTTSPSPGTDASAAQSRLGLAVSSATRGTPVTRSAVPSDAELPALPRDLSASLVEGATLWCMSREVHSEDSELRVPIPAEPGLYKLLVVAQAQDGQTAAQFKLLDAQHACRVEVSVPPRMTLGDRATVTVRLENAAREPIDAQVRWDISDVLHVEALRAEPDPSASAKLGALAEVRLPAEGRIWLHSDVEAARVGTGHAAIEVRTNSYRQTAECGFAVLPLDTTPTTATANVTRTIAVWSPPPGLGDLCGAISPEEPSWAAAPLTAETRLQVGQLLEIAEEITLHEPASAVVWRQVIPPVCTAVLGPSVQAAFLGPRQPDEDGALVFHAAKLSAGPRAHRYFLLVVRPGVAVFPAPQVQSGGIALPVALEPAELPLVVPAP